MGSNDTWGAGGRVESVGVSQEFMVSLSGS